jgi:hypothetical protein
MNETYTSKAKFLFFLGKPKHLITTPYDVVPLAMKLVASMKLVAWDWSRPRENKTNSPSVVSNGFHFPIILK